MALETVFLDAGGVLLHPNWWRVSDALAARGVVVSPEALIKADPPARRELDDRSIADNGFEGSERRAPPEELVQPDIERAYQRTTPPRFEERRVRVLDGLQH